MKKFFILVLITCFFSTADAASRRRGDTQSSDAPLSLGVTHILPSAYVIPGGTLILGTTVGAGFFGLFDLTTNLYLDFYSVYNVAAKFNLFASEDFAFAVHASYVSQTIKSQPIENGPITSYSATAVAPGVTFSYRIAQRIVGHIGGKIVNRNPALTKDQFIPKTGYVQGSTINKEFAFGLGTQTSLAIGASYDLTYDIPGAGLSFYLGNFQIGAHYYFGVTDGAVQPIIGGGYTASF